MSELVKGLLITGIGMGLVFVVIIMLWGVMAGLVGITSGSRIKKGETDEMPVATDTVEVGGVKMEGSGLKRKAAAIAVAYALQARSVQSVSIASDVSTNQAGSWVAVGRARQLNDQILRGRR